MGEQRLEWRMLRAKREHRGCLLAVGVEHDGDDGIFDFSVRLPPSARLHAEPALAWSSPIDGFDPRGFASACRSADAVTDAVAAALRAWLSRAPEWRKLPEPSTFWVMDVGGARASLVKGVSLWSTMLNVGDAWPLGLADGDRATAYSRPFDASGLRAAQAKATTLLRRTALAMGVSDAGRVETHDLVDDED